jgi:hypothetical protein
MIVHFVDDEWCLRSELLDFFEFEGSHTGKRTAEAIYSCLEEYKIVQKVRGVPTIVQFS